MRRHDITLSPEERDQLKALTRSGVAPARKFTHALPSYDIALGKRSSFFLEAMPGLTLGNSGDVLFSKFFWPGFGLGFRFRL